MKNMKQKKQTGDNIRQARVLVACEYSGIRNGGHQRSKSFQGIALAMGVDTGDKVGWTTITIIFIAILCPVVTKILSSGHLILKK